MNLPVSGVLSVVLALCMTGCGAQGVSSAASPASAAGSSSPLSSAVAPLTVRCLSAGSADCFLFLTGGGAVVIDTGESSFGSELVRTLAGAGITELEALIVTHFDQDHVGGAAALLGAVRVKTVLQSDCPKESSEYSAYVAALAKAGVTPVTVRQKTSFSVGGVTFLIDPPQQTEYESDDSNNSSLITEVTCGTVRLLFAGDAETERLAEYVAEGRGTFSFLKVPHHGRTADGLGAFLASVSPSQAVITSSAEEPEDSSVVSALEKLGAKVWLTRRGEVTLTADGTSLTVEQNG